MGWGIHEVVGLVGDALVADGLRPVLYFSHVDGPIALFRPHSEPVDLVDDVHLELAVGVAVVGVVDLLAEHLVVEGVVEGQREDLVEDLQDLHLEVSGLDGGEGLIKHVLQVLQVALIERLQPSDLHPVLNQRQVFQAWRGGNLPAEESSTEGKFLVVGEGIR
jgi:hypothetical protein